MEALSSPAFKDLLIHLTTIQSVANQTLCCLVLDIRECVYTTLEGLAITSDRPPLTERELPFPVPEGLAPCDKCGYMVGECFNRGQKLRIACLCEADICRRCHTPVYKFKIGTCNFSFRTGKLPYTSSGAAMAHQCQPQHKPN